MSMLAATRSWRYHRSPPIPTKRRARLQRVKECKKSDLAHAKSFMYILSQILYSLSYYIPYYVNFSFKQAR